MDTTPYQEGYKQAKFDLYEKCYREAEEIARQQYYENLQKKQQVQYPPSTVDTSHWKNIQPELDWAGFPVQPSSKKVYENHPGQSTHFDEKLNPTQDSFSDFSAGIYIYYCYLGRKHIEIKNTDDLIGGDEFVTTSDWKSSYQSFADGDKEVKIFRPSKKIVQPAYVNNSRPISFDTNRSTQQSQKLMDNPYSYPQRGPNSMLSSIASKISNNIDYSEFVPKDIEPPSTRSIPGYTGYKKRQ